MLDHHQSDTYPMEHRVHAVAVRMIDAGNGHLPNSQAVRSSLYQQFNTEPETALRDAEGVQRSAAVAPIATLGVTYLDLGAQVVKPGYDVNAELPVTWNLVIVQEAGADDQIGLSN